MTSKESDVSEGVEECQHARLGFHSGGYYVGCLDCNVYWVAVKHPNDAAIDYGRQSPLAGFGHFEFRAATLSPPLPSPGVERLLAGNCEEISGGPWDGMKGGYRVTVCFSDSSIGGKFFHLVNTAAFDRDAALSALSPLEDRRE